MTTYDIIARRNVLRALRFQPELTKRALEQNLAGATVEALAGDPFNEIRFRVQLKRSTHEQALNEIGALVWNYSFDVAQAVVSEVAGDAVEAFFVDTFGEGDLVLAVATIAAKITEVLAGAEIGKIRRDYEARQDHNGSWTLTKLQQQQTAGMEARPGLLQA